MDPSPSDLKERIEAQRGEIDRLQRKVDVLASALDVAFGGTCYDCDGMVVRKDNTLVCTACRAIQSA
ncbi:hypothetical protein [Halomarina pelagica]|uniref:hypothetical protein n=1 Tax=Halomarina pelagica TaxID=2961599 RepID=UPI0020C302C5|nr:hypothetical protein [Halomarina sp. BND7]